MPWHLINNSSDENARNVTIEVEGALSVDEIFYLEGDLIIELNTEPYGAVTLDLRRFDSADFGLFAALYQIRKRIKNPQPMRILVKAGSEAASTLHQGRFSTVYEIVEG